ncbi:MAG TPA: rod shape-determining protein RodA [Rhodocyclaceae bacterium]|nr:MAG: rod shape-determining protein RodA [Rhodocyclales bacterium CG17_big_fil_post_rev_8_21_14_2_50_68_7]HCX33159.1 rod shape-determining protein RodA [Rhodocyclaceae bacterium]
MSLSAALRALPLHPRVLWAKLAAPIDPPLMAIVATLLACGMMVLASASADNPLRLVSQAGNLAVALTLMRIAAQIPPQGLMRLAPPVYVLAVLLLVAVALAGDVSKGARRWLNLGVARIQPSEIMKIAMPMMLAWYFQKREAMAAWHDFVVAALILLLPVGLIAKQPDLGTAVVVAATGLFAIFLAGLSWKLVVPVLAAAAAGVVLLVASGDSICRPEVDWPGLREYQKHRVCTLLDPGSDPLGKGFHTIQSTIALGSGAILGKGWMQGTQAHLEFLPERHTDFIFAVAGEEFGLVGGIALLLLYAALIGRGLMIAAGAPTLFARLLAASLALSYFAYAFVNIGMVSGILPVVGVPLPFVSYGGSALVALLLGVGILMSIQKHRMLVQK